MIALARRAHPLVWIASACACGLLFLLGALSYQASDRELPPGSTAVVQVQQVTASEREAIAALENAAQTHHVNLLRIGANPAGPDASPWYFAFIGDQALFESNFPAGAYPAFSPNAIPEVFNGSELSARDQPVRGTYAVQGMDVDRFAIQETLANAGLGAQTQLVDPARNYLSGLLRSSSWPLLLTSVLGLALSIVYWVTFSRKSTAIQELHGFRPARIIFEQSLTIISVFISASVLTLALGSGLLLLYNGGNQFLLFIPWVLQPMLVLGGIAVGTQLLASVSALKLPGYAAVKGARPMRLLGVAAALSQAVMLVLVYASVVQASGGAAAVATDSRTFENWEPDERSVTVQINPHAFEDPSSGTFEPDVAAAYRSFGEIFTRLDGEGSAVLSAHRSNQDTGVPNAPLESYGPSGGNALVVNNNYLERHPLLDSAGAQLKGLPSKPGTVHLLIPEHLAPQSEALTASWAKSTLMAWDPIFANEPDAAFAVVPHIIKDGQQVFNYGNTWDMKRWVQTGPVVAVVSPQTRYISDYILLGVAANNGNVVFTDADRFRALSGQAGLMQRFSGVNSPATHAAQQLRERNTQLFIAVGNAFIGAMTLLVAVILLAAIYADAVRFRSFLKRTHGWRATRIHWPFVGAVTVASATVIAASMVLLRPVGFATDTVMATVAMIMSLTVAGSIVAATASLDRRARADLIKRR